MMLSAPLKRLPMYSVLALFFFPGTGPLGFAREASPFPFATSKRFPSGVTRTEVGYQPTGMKPSDRLLPMIETSKTAMLLLHALATNNVFSSGDKARLLGVEPGGWDAEKEA